MEGSLYSQGTTIIPACQEHTATVIFIHGMGQSNITWKMAVAEAWAHKLPNVLWILPQAQERPVSFNQGRRRPSWFDIARLPPGPEEYDERVITDSISLIEDLILSQVHSGIDSRRIVLIGFSQGAALSMMVSMTTLHSLGGVVSLSGWIPPRARNITHAPSTFPVLWCHGTIDMEIPLSYAEDAISFLRTSIGIQHSNLQLRVYEGLEHTINDNELNDVLSWLGDLLG